MTNPESRTCDLELLREGRHRVREAAGKTSQHTEQKQQRATELPFAIRTLLIKFHLLTFELKRKKKIRGTTSEARLQMWPRI